MPARRVLPVLLHLCCAAFITGPLHGAWCNMCGMLAVRVHMPSLSLVGIACRTWHTRTALHTCLQALVSRCSLAGKNDKIAAPKRQRRAWQPNNNQFRPKGSTHGHFNPVEGPYSDAASHHVRQLGLV